MFKQERFLPHQKIICNSVVVIAIFHICSYVFSKSVKKEIKERANGKCESCGTNVESTNKLIAAHIKHGIKDHPENGMAHCEFCEAQYHLRHADDPRKTINLSITDNDSTTYGHVSKLPFKQKQALISEFSDQWSGVLKRLKKKY